MMFNACDGIWIAIACIIMLIAFVMETCTGSQRVGVTDTNPEHTQLVPIIGRDKPVTSEPKNVRFNLPEFT